MLETPRWILRCGLPAVVLAAFGGLTARAQTKDAPKPPPVDATAAGEMFARDVAPLLTKHCGDCHSADFAERKLDLGGVASVLRGSEAGPIVSPGSASASLLIQVLAKEAKPHMPPKGQLAGEEIAAISKWIDALAADTVVGAPQVTDEDRAHWSFRPVARPALPQVKDAAWTITPIDRFILAELEEHDLAPSPPADKATLLRRVYFDLIGLPPTPEAVEAFLRDESPDAYERVVDRLLASPRYGERWGRHWLDLARYADSGGFHNDLDRPNAWRYRDYVIDAFNADRPYGEFIREQLAGDELPGATLDDWIATGFCRNGPSNDDNMGKTPTDRERYRMDELDDIVSTTANVFLGLTIGCARCHDHKYDPLSQRDYYRFTAYFANAERKELTLEGFDPAHPELKPVPRKPDEKTPQAMVLSDFGEKPQPMHLLWRGDVLKKGPVVTPGVPAVLSTGESSAKASSDKSNESPRLQLADWIADRDNPLTWRVMANRLWQHHFGRGLAASPSNFGRLGERPTHPELLDWLADELRRGDGRLKPLHRLIVTSSVYRQSSQTNADGLVKDSDNRLWWRTEKRRLEAEPLRDAVLATAGTLNFETGGPGVKPRIRPDLLVASQRNKWPIVKQEGPEHWRRSVFVYVKRQLQLPMLELFDAPNSTHSCARRDESLVPTQALVLMNDDFMRDQAGFMARRVEAEAEEDPLSQAERALIIALARQPSAERVAEASAFLDAQTGRLNSEGLSAEEAKHAALVDLCHVLMNLSEFSYVD